MCWGFFVGLEFFVCLFVSLEFYGLTHEYIVLCLGSSVSMKESFGHHGELC